MLKGQFYVYVIFNFRIFETEIRLNYISSFILISLLVEAFQKASKTRGASKEGSMPVMRI